MTKKNLLIAAGIFIAIAILLTAAVHTKAIDLGKQTEAIANSLN